MDFLKAIEQERERLATKLEELHAQRTAIDEQIASVNSEIKAINAYESAKGGKPKAPRAKRSSSITTQIINLVKTTPMSRGQILEALQGKGNKTVEQSVSNALSNLKKKGKLTAKDGVYSST